MANPNGARHNLTPFTGEEGRKRASAAGKKGAESRRRKKEEAELAKIETSTDLQLKLEDIRTTFQRSSLSAAAASTAQYLMALVVSGSVTLSGKDIAPLIGQLVDVARLEEGQSTSNSVVAHLSSTETLTRLQELRGQDEASLGPQPQIGDTNNPGAFIKQNTVTPAGGVG